MVYNLHSVILFALSNLLACCLGKVWKELVGCESQEGKDLICKYEFLNDLHTDYINITDFKY